MEEKITVYICYKGASIYYDYLTFADAKALLELVKVIGIVHEAKEESEPKKEYVYLDSRFELGPNGHSFNLTIDVKEKLEVQFR